MKPKIQFFKQGMSVITMAVIAVFILTSERGVINSSKTGEIVSIQLHSKHLENTVTKESPYRSVSIYLPPNYQNETKRYPVVYLLHGIAGTDKDWTTPWTSSQDLPTIKEIMDKGINTGKFGKMIVVMPDQKTNWFGSFYTNSKVTGDWESFTTKDLVDYIDRNYRTIADANHRGLGGHSMGGYGAITLSMKYPEVFSVAYGLSSAFIDFNGGFSIEGNAHRNAAKARSFQELSKDNNIHTMAVVTISQAFSPNSDNPPFYADLPMKEVNGELIVNKPGYDGWKAHSPIEMVRKHRKNLKKLKGIMFDAGDKDEFPIVYINSRALSKELKRYGIEHTYDEYSGNHRDQLWGTSGRIYNVMLPYFWKNFR